VIRPVVVAAADELLARRKHDALPAGVTAHAMRRDEGDKERLKALAEGRDWAPAAPIRLPSTPSHPTPRTTKAPRLQGFDPMGAAGFEPATSRV
jgi:hypothetical protein